MTRISQALSKAFSDGASRHGRGAEPSGAGMPLAGWVPRLRSPARAKELIDAVPRPDIRHHRLDQAHAVETAETACQSTQAFDAVLPEVAGVTAVNQLPWPALTARLLDSRAASEIRGLAAALCAQAQHEPNRGLLFLGATSACGCTTTLLTLARAIHEQRAVNLLLADANLANPTISKEFGALALGQAPESGDPSVRAGVKTSSLIPDRLSLLSLGRIASPVELTREWNLSLNRLLAECQLALIDGGTASAAIERGPHPLSVIRSFVLVHRASQGLPDELASTIESALHLKCLGVIETFWPGPLAANRSARPATLATTWPSVHAPAVQINSMVAANNPPRIG